MKQFVMFVGGLASVSFVYAASLDSSAPPADTYSGVIGTAPTNVTVSSVGVGVQESTTGIDTYVLWTQTLANSIYYEGQLYWRYALNTVPTAFSTIPTSREDNPNGGKIVGMLGYNLHLTDDYQITPYFRGELGRNTTGFAYADRDGDYVHATAYALLLGFKQTLTITPLFSPYINIWGGINQLKLTGSLIEGPTPNQQIKGSDRQGQLSTEFGFAYKLTAHQVLVPYMRLEYHGNHPDFIAAQSFLHGGLNVTSLTTSSVLYGLKYNIYW